MKLLCEVRDDIECIQEDKGEGKKSFYLEGVFMQSDIANKNKRMYPSKIMEKEVNRYINDVISKNQAVGELSHPNTANINLERVSHKIEELRMDGSNVIGKAKLLETPLGKTARGLVEGGVRLGVSSRGLGSLKQVKDGLMEVGPDFKLVTVDIVSDPSAPDAWVNAVMEGAEWVWDERTGEWKAMEVLENTKKSMKKMTITELNQAKYRLFENYLAHLTTSK